MMVGSSIPNNNTTKELSSSTGNLQIFSYWVKGGGIASASSSLNSISQLSLNEKKKIGGSKRDLFEYSTPIPKLLSSDENENDNYNNNLVGIKSDNKGEIKVEKVEKVSLEQEEESQESESSALASSKCQNEEEGEKEVETETEAAEESNQNENDSSVQANQFKSAGSQSKERKSSSSVAQFGTVYQPAGPLIEPHKISSVPAGLLPETVKLPPDLKVTYQTHPPSSNPSTVSQSSSKSRKHAAPSTSSTTTTSSSSSSSHHKDRSGSAGGQILHQPYKSASAGASASSSSAGRQVYSSGTTGSGSYMNLNASTATGSPLLISQQSATSSLNLPHPGHHSISSGAQSQAASAGAPSAGGLFYSSTGFTPHHSPFAPNKYPMVPPESYRTHSPYQNSYLYPSTTPQQSQYFMTPFYTPPLTPNPNPLISGGLGTMVGVGAGQVRPMSLHHPSIAAASFYPQSAPQPGGMGIHPSSYLVASPHHSLQPAPTAPGHAGLFPLNPCTQPACPTESCPPNSTSNNKQQPQQSAFNALPQDHQEGALGAKPAKALSTNTPRPIRPNKHPLATTPTIAAVDTPPITIQLITSNQNSQARQLESAKTFTEQYSLPDDITITPIIVNNASALLLKNTSISIVNPPTSSPKSINSTVPVGKGSPGTNKKKERDIVHVIDPRSGHKTTIAKHISNRNLLAKCNINKNLKNTNFTPNATTTTTTATTTIHANKVKPNIQKHGATGVGKLNPDLDVIVIQNNGNADCDEMSITENLAHNIASNKKSPQQVNSGKKLSKKSLAGMTAAAHAVVVGVKGGKNKRVVVTVNENVKNSSRMNLQNSPINYSLPPGISVSSGSPTYNHNQGLNLSTKARVHNNNSQNHNDSNFVQVQPVNSFAQQQEQQKGKKRITLNDCIDGLQKKRLKLLEEHNLLDVHSGASAVTYNGIANNVIPKTSTPHNFSRLPPLSLSSRNGSLSSFGSGRGKYSDSSYSSARVRDTQILRGCTVIQSCDAEAAVSAVVEDHETYFRKKARLSSSNNNNKGIKLKNGFNKGNNKFHSKKTHPFHPQQTFVVGMSKVKSNSSKGMDNKRYSSQRNTRSTAANAKIRTRFSANKPKGDATTNANSNHGPPRNRSRLLRGGGGGGGSGAGNLRGDSDSSTNNSRSNSAVRIVNGHTSTGLGLGKSDRENKKFPTQAFINAVADLYQYRRNVLLRTPLSGVGVFPSASSINLSSLNLSSRSSQSPGEKTTTQQLSPSIPFQNVPIVASATASLSSAESTCSSVANHVGLGPSVMKQPVGSMAANAAKKRAVIKPLSPSAINGALIQMGLAVRRTPKWSNGWRFEGEPYETKVYLNNDDQSVLRRCYPAMRHEGGDVIQTRDCVLLKSGSKKNDLPFIAKIAALWENPADGEMMFSLLWYYRPEHTEMGRTKEDMPDEIFASKHIDANSVATIDDRCYVLTFNEYCRYRKRLKQLQESLPNKPLLSLLSETAMINNNASAKIAGAVWSGRLAESEPNRTPSGKISPEVVFFCRKVYDFRQKRIMKNPS